MHPEFVGGPRGAGFSPLQRSHPDGRRNLPTRGALRTVKRRERRAPPPTPPDAPAGDFLHTPPLPLPLLRRRTICMLAKVCSAAVQGIEAYPVEVEVDSGSGDTVIVMIGAI
jgi:hypothetical protein